MPKEGEDAGDETLGYASGGRYAWRVDGVYSEERPYPLIFPYISPISLTPNPHP